MEVELWSKVTEMGISTRASSLVLQTESSPRDVCMAPGNGKLPDPDGPRRASNSGMAVWRKFAMH